MDAGWGAMAGDGGAAVISGPGVCSPLEGGIAVEAAVEALGAAWTYDYQPSGATAMLRAQHYGTDAWSDTLERVRQGEIDFTLMLNEPLDPIRYPNHSQDRIAPVDAARILTEWDERAWTIARNEPHPYDVKVPWGGLGVLLNGDAGYAYERAYLDAGGPLPRYRCAHYYAWDAAGLVSELGRYQAHVDATGGGVILLTEIGGAPGISQSKRFDILRAAFGLGLHGWAWFSSRMPGVWAENDLMHADGSLTPLGSLYRSLATGEPWVKPPLDKSVYFPVVANA